MTIENKIMLKLDEFIKTTDGNKKFGIALSDKNTMVSFDYVKAISDEFLKDLKLSISEIESEVIAEILTNSVTVSKPIKKGNFGLGFEINFDHSVLQRKSLWEKGYPEGVDLAYLINNGYTAKNYVYGNSQSKYKRSRLHRNSEKFIQETVEKFKGKYPNVIIDYNSNYDKNKS